MTRQTQLVNKPTATMAVIALVLAIAGPASAQPDAIDAQHSTITIHAFKSGLLRAIADNHLIQTTITEGSVEDSPTAHVDLVVDAQRLQILDPDLSPKSREFVQTRMLGPDVLDATRFPQIRFHSTVVQRLEAGRWLVRGNLDLHGQTHEVEVEVTREDGRYIGRGSLRQSDFAIPPISVAGGTIKVKDELSIEFDIVTAQSQKPASLHVPTP